MINTLLWPAMFIFRLVVQIIYCNQALSRVGLLPLWGDLGGIFVILGELLAFAVGVALAAFIPINMSDPIRVGAIIFIWFVIGRIWHNECESCVGAPWVGLIDVIMAFGFGIIFGELLILLFPNGFHYPSSEINFQL